MSGEEHKNENLDCSLGCIDIEQVGSSLIFVSHQNNEEKNNITLTAPWVGQERRVGTAQKSTWQSLEL